MDCECKICKRNRRITAAAAPYTLEVRTVVAEMLEELMTVEMDLVVANAVIDGSWPTADEWIAQSRAKHKKADCGGE